MNPENTIPKSVPSDKSVKFTPGPWERAKNKSRGGSGKVRGLSISRVVDSNGFAVAFMYPRRRQVANLQLIAAAPEMYALLKQLHGVLAKVPLLQDEIEKVLKKARGEE